MMSSAADVSLLTAVDETHVAADFEVGARAGFEFLRALARLEYFDFNRARILGADSVLRRPTIVVTMSLRHAGIIRCALRGDEA